MKEENLIMKIRLITLFFIGALIASGITAFPLVRELEILSSLLGITSDIPVSEYSGFKHWIATVNEGIINANNNHPFLFYGTDWLAFAHIVIAIVFVGLYRKPVTNRWLIYWAMIACVCVIPLAAICGNIRGIPGFWILIDCSFGVFGIIPLILLHKYIQTLKRLVNHIDTKY